MSFLKCSISILMLCLTVSAKAEYFAESFTVEALMPSGNGLHVKLSPNPTQCTGSWWGTQFLIDKSVENYEVLVSSMLAAYMSGKKLKAVHYSVSGSGACNAGNQLNINIFQVTN